VLYPRLAKLIQSQTLCWLLLLPYTKGEGKGREESEEKGGLSNMDGEGYEGESTFSGF
jgi:hypothetical protein